MLLTVILVVLGIALLIAVFMSIFVKRHGEASVPEAGWVPTSEMFRDPGTDRIMRVWTDQRGVRHYLPE